MTSPDADLEEYCRDLYVRAGQEWDRVRHEFVTGELAFGILYGPPRLKPPLLILGTNPGYDEDDDSKTWPNENLFAVYPPPPPRNPDFWTLAREMVDCFTLNEQMPILKESVPTNVLFFKSRGMERNMEHGLGWRNNPQEGRERLENWCANEVKKLAAKINPTRILVLGITPYRKIAEQADKEYRGSRCALYGRGSVFDKPAMGIAHPTGCWWLPAEERRQIEQGLARFLSSE